MYIDIHCIHNGSKTTKSRLDAEIFFGITWQKFLVTKPVKVAKPSRGIFIARLFREPPGFGPRTARNHKTRSVFRCSTAEESLVVKRLVLFDTCKIIINRSMTLKMFGICTQVLTMFFVIYMSTERVYCGSKH